MAYARRISFEPPPLQVHVAGLIILFTLGEYLATIPLFSAKDCAENSRQQEALNLTSSCISKMGD